MWMMGYNDGGELLNNNNNNNNININIQDSFNGRRLRQLMPRPPTTSTTLIHAAGTHDLLALNHHFEAMAEQNKRVLNNNSNTQQIVVSSRWNPTPEQLQTLEELYRRGTRTPSAEQIQLITAQLRRYGKIEGKNVFYWFQNHKARERQKRRRQLHQPPPLDNYNGEKKESSLTGANRSVYEVEQTKNWASPTNSSTIAPEKQGGRGAATECKGADDGWLQFDYNNNNNNNNNNNEEEEEAAKAAAAEEEITTILQQQQRKNATWQQMMHLSCSSSSSPAPITTTTTTIQSTTMVMPKDKHFNILLEPYGSNGRGGGEEAAATQTLQLFPLLGDGDGDEKDNASTMMDSTTNHVTPYPFFEFLPLKN